MENFTPASAAIGGALIGVSATLLMLLHGRIAGISGIVAGVLSPVQGDWQWRAAFVGGLFAAPLIVWLAVGEKPPAVFPHPLALVAAGGALVGIGSRLGSGCTSGHGVCGMARLSRRSMAATATFMATAIATVFVVRVMAG